MSNFYNKLKFPALFFLAKEMGEKRAIFQFVLEIAQEAVFLILICLNNHAGYKKIQLFNSLDTNWYRQEAEIL